MKYKDLFSVVIKSIALYFLIASIYGAAQSIFILLNEKAQYSYYNLLYLGGFLLDILFCVLIIAKTDWLILKLKLSDKFEEDAFSFGQISNLQLLKTLAICIGFYYLSSGFISLISLAARNLTMDRAEYLLQSGNWNGSLPDLLSMAIGFLLITNSTGLAGMLSRSQEQNEKQNT